MYRSNTHRYGVGIVELQPRSFADLLFERQYLLEILHSENQRATNLLRRVPPLEEILSLKTEPQIHRSAKKQLGWLRYRIKECIRQEKAILSQLGKVSHEIQARERWHHIENERQLQFQALSNVNIQTIYKGGQPMQLNPLSSEFRPQGILFPEWIPQQPAQQWNPSVYEYPPGREVADQEIGEYLEPILMRKSVASKPVLSKKTERPSRRSSLAENHFSTLERSGTQSPVARDYLLKARRPAFLQRRSSLGSDCLPKKEERPEMLRRSSSLAPESSSSSNKMGEYSPSATDCSSSSNETEIDSPLAMKRPERCSPRSLSMISNPTKQPTVPSRPYSPATDSLSALKRLDRLSIRTANSFSPRCSPLSVSTSYQTERPTLLNHRSSLFSDSSSARRSPLSISATNRAERPMMLHRRSSLTPDSPSTSNPMLTPQDRCHSSPQSPIGEMWVGGISMNKIVDDLVQSVQTPLTKDVEYFDFSAEK